MPEITLNKPNRKFKGAEQYDLATSSYFLMPFRFHRLNDEKEVLVNEVGVHLVLPNGTAQRIILKHVSKIADDVLYADLLSGCFISEERIPPLIDVLATRYRTKKAFLDGFTCLHLFVISLRCEHTCHYCQVSRVTADKDAFDMSINHINQGIDMMLRSPNQFLTMELQGGEAFAGIR